jgi:hypothetical protein
MNLATPLKMWCIVKYGPDVTVILPHTIDRDRDGAMLVFAPTCALNDWKRLNAAGYRPAMVTITEGWE